MMVLVDTVVTGRRNRSDLNRREQALTQALAELIREGRAQIMGLIRQELLSGLREAERFDKLRT
jgi:hypothetical protein